MTINFEPWQGPEAKKGIAEQRVLILGESHYHDCSNAPECRDEPDDSDSRTRHREMTRGVISWWKDNPHRSPLSYRVPQLFSLPKSQFWNAVAFYNYLQTLAGPKARLRPSDEQWSDPSNALAFQKVLDDFEPDRILVLGKKTWQNLPSSPAELYREPLREFRLPVSNDLGGSQNVDTSCYWYFAATGKPALAMPIMHPAAPRFVTEAWIEPVAEWMRFPPPPLSGLSAR
jgi:hypothetical protein